MLTIEELHGFQNPTGQGYCILVVEEIMDIEYKQYPAQWAACARCIIQTRAEIQPMLADMARQIPAGQVNGPPFCIFNFITSVTEGEDVTLGFPIAAAFESPDLEVIRLPAIEVLSSLHLGAVELLGETLRTLFVYARDHAIISDEFYREVYPSALDAGQTGIEVQFVIHNWNAKLAAGTERVLGIEACEIVMQGSEKLGVDSGLEARFAWTREMLARMDGLADPGQKWDILSGCAHVFPRSQVDKLTAVFQQARSGGADGLEAVDAVIAFMESDPGWVEGGKRSGRAITVSKKPRDPKAYASAQTDLERRQAYCFCPLVRSKMDQGMPVDFCNCGSGWFRQQWEGAIGRPVRVEVLQSVLRGDERCEFAIHLPEDL
jgi:hypothetical protein